MKILNLGAGNRIAEGAVNHDLHKHRAEIDVVWDLNEVPWPWPTDHFDQIYASKVFEHLKLTLIESLNECWRIVKPDGEVHITYPVFTSPNIHKDPTHRWFLSEVAVDYVDPATEFGERYIYYTPYKWEIVRKDVDEYNCMVVLTPRNKGEKLWRTRNQHS